MWRTRVQTVMALAAVALPTPSASPAASPSPRPSTSPQSSASPRASASASPSPSPTASPSPSQGPTGPDPVRTQQWYLGFLHINQAHQVSQGAGVVVAVLDSGVAVHPDLQGSVLPGTDFTAAKSDGRNDGSGQGTRMAGLIAGHGRILGIAPKANILPVKPEFANDHGGVVDTEEPIRWAVDHGAGVISLSIGDDSANPAWGRAIAYAVSQNVVVVVAVNDRDQGTHPPGLAMPPGVVVVSGTDRDGNLDPDSLTGDVITVAAPSQDCWSTQPGGEYGSRSGTSNSAAITAGVVALIRSRFPDLDGPGVVARLTATADDRGAPGRDPLYGFGVVNPLRALTEPLPSLSANPSPAEVATPSPSAPAEEPAGPRPLWMAIALGGGALAIAVGLGLLGRLRARNQIG